MFRALFNLGYKISIQIFEKKGNCGIMADAIEQPSSPARKAGAKKATAKKKTVNESIKKTTTGAASKKKPSTKKAAPKKKIVKKTVKKTVKKAESGATTKKAVSKKKAIKKVAKKTDAAGRKKEVSGRTITYEDRWKMIEEAAYLRAEKHGFAGVNPVDDWLAAEAEVNRYLEENNIQVTQT